MISDALNRNVNMKYDQRNLILELEHTKYILNDSLILLTKYYYDEAGNRIRKMTYDTEDDSLKSDIIYSRDVSGRELAVYDNGSIKQWNLFGVDNIGYMTGSDELRFYLKDHLGSVRVVTDNQSGVINCQDYDQWGYVLENRVYQSEESVYKFTSKERDEESLYDYFGARYYDARVGRWGSEEPLLDKYPGLSPYIYSIDNPLRLIDANGLEPIKKQTGTASAYKEILNNTPSRVGETIGTAAEQKLLSLGESELTFNGLQPKNTYFNTTQVRYIYTKYGGWIDMAHFLFYAGRAYTIKGYGESDPIGSAVQEGYLQEFMDPAHTKYSYEDLPSDKFGAIFAIQYFDPNSNSTLSEQISDFLIYTLGAKDPENAPNYLTLPQEDSKKSLSRINRSTIPLYTEENP